MGGRSPAGASLEAAGAGGVHEACSFSVRRASPQSATALWEDGPGSWLYWSAPSPQEPVEKLLAPLHVQGASPHSPYVGWDSVAGLLHIDLQRAWCSLLDGYGC